MRLIVARVGREPRRRGHPAGPAGRARTVARLPRPGRLAGRWCGTIWPTPALAQQAGMSDDDYEMFLNRALFLDQPDPMAISLRMR